MLQYTTYASSTLGFAYTAGDLSLQVAAGEGGRFPTNGDFWIRIGNSSGTIRKCTSRVGDQLVLAAGATDGTTDANATAGDSVDWVLGAAALNQLRADLVQTGAYASKPAASALPPGTLYLPTDSAYELLRSTGSTWSHFKGGRQLTPPELADFSWVNQGGATALETYGGVYLSVPAVSGDNGRYLVKALPSAPYSMTALIQLNLSRYSYNQAGLALRESSSGKLIKLGLVTHQFSDTDIRSQVCRMNSATSFDGCYLDVDVGLTAFSLCWLRIRDDLTNLHFELSPDGIIWRTLASAARTAFLTADQGGFYCESVSSDSGCDAWLLHFQAS